MSEDRTPGPLGFDDDDLPAPREDGPERPPPPPPGRTPASRMSWFVGALIFLALAYITLNTIRTVGEDAPGSRGLAAHRVLPAFAAPLAPNPRNEDANVARQADSGDLGRRPACEVRARDVLNVCQLAERGPVVLAFLAAPAKSCQRQLDVIDRVRVRFPEVQFAAVGIRGDRRELGDLVEEHRWGFPVAHDKDGVVANLYGVAGCPTLTFAYPGGIVMRSTVGSLDELALGRQLRRLIAGAVERGWTPPR